MNTIRWNLTDQLTLSSFGFISNNIALEILTQFENFDHFIGSENRYALRLKQGGLFSDKIAEAKNNAVKQIEICEQKNVSIISIIDDSYPQLLKEITGPPIILFVSGNLQPSNTFSISIVGTRRITQYGQRATELFATEFAQNGIIVTSGLATGVDSCAHSATIKSNGITYAIIASGVDCLSPSDATLKAKKIIEEGGAIISEYWCGTPAQRAYFPQRNRIISGISKATLIIESAERGGALITAKFAFDQQRELYALPGNIFSERSQGTHNLIRDNLARIAINPSQILQDLGIKSSTQSLFDNSSLINLSDADRAVIEHLSHEPLHIDELCSLANMNMPSILVKLLEFEFKGLVKQMPGKYYIKA
jgi:DNA processing protein